MKTVIENKELDITVKQSEDMNKLFVVTYGLHVKEGLTYDEAAQEYGLCVFHALSCNSVVDNSETFKP